METLPERNGAVRRADVPPDVKRALDEGRDETRTLAEWLVVDAVTLMDHAAVDVGLDDDREQLVAAVRGLDGESITKRQVAIGELLFETLRTRPDGDEVFERLATHRSDVVRAWAALSVRADPTLDLPERLAAARRFATDSNAAVREIAWDVIRPAVVADLDRGIDLLEVWVRDDDPFVRRCAVEATRPCGVWTPHVPALKAEPERGLSLLEPVRSDESDYVRRAVANWLNDASKTRPDWVETVCNRWLEASPTPETEWTVQHAMRTIRKGASAT